VVDSPDEVTGKVAELEPCGITTVAGVIAAVLVVDKLIVAPPGPAGPFRVTVPVVEFPPTSVVEAKERPCNAAGLIVSVAV